MDSSYFIEKMFLSEKAMLIYRFLAGYIVEKSLDGILATKPDKLTTPELLARQLYEALDGAFKLTCEKNKWEYDENALLCTFSDKTDLWLKIKNNDDLNRILGIAVGNEYTNLLTYAICDYWIDVFSMEVACRQQLYNYLLGQETRKIEHQVGELVKDRYIIKERGCINGIGDIYYVYDMATGKDGIIKGENDKNQIIGMTIGNRYTIVKHLGKGGCGNVYKGLDRHLRRDVAIKVFFDCPDQWKNELDILKSIKHKRLTYIIDVIEIPNNCLAIVMDYIQGDDLMTIIEKSGHLLIEQAWSVLKQMCDALSYLHENNPQIIHGDIKPNNIMLSPSGEVTLIDFNLSQKSNGLNIPNGRTDGYSPPEFYLGDEWEKRQFSETPTSTFYPHEYFEIDFPRRLRYGAMAGKYNSDALFYAETPDYKSKYHFKSVVSIRSDIYSLGATLFFIVTGKHPWPASIIDKELESVDQRFVDIIHTCMSLNPYDRYRSVRDIEIPGM